jgi:NurA-like 5'-3' nuclease
MANLHHCHWKCTIYYRETIESGYPFPYRCTRDRVEVVHMDLDHLHLYVGNSPDAQRSVTRDLTGN